MNPSAKLPLTFARSEADLPQPQLTKQPPRASAADLVGIFPDFKDSTRKFDVTYDEGLKVGYKWYDAEKKEILYPLGFGLSYTTYKHSGLKAFSGSVGFRVANTGERACVEIAEDAALPRGAGEPIKRLVAWQNVKLAPGEVGTGDITSRCAVSFGFPCREKCVGKGSRRVCDSSRRFIARLAPAGLMHLD